MPLKFLIRNWFTANFLGYRMMSDEFHIVGDTRYTGNWVTAPPHDDICGVMEYQMRWRFRVIEWVKGLFNV